MKKALAIGLAAVMAISMSAPVFAEDEGKGIAKEDLKVGVIYIGDENECFTAILHFRWLVNIKDCSTNTVYQTITCS